MGGSNGPWFVAAARPPQMRTLVRPMRPVTNMHGRHAFVLRSPIVVSSSGPPRLYAPIHGRPAEAAEFPRPWSFSAEPSDQVEAETRSAYLLLMPILVIQHSNASDTGLIGEALLRHGLRCQTIRLADGDRIPADLDGIDGILSMGGSASAMDDSLPWIADELALLAAASSAQIPVLGVCLGAQLLARALGGTVARMESASVGPCRVDMTVAGRDDPMFRGLPWYATWPAWHQDEITSLPPEARLLAKSEACGVEAFAHGVFAYGVQFHPEWTATRIVELCEDPADHLDPGADYGGIKAAVRDDAEAIGRMGARFAENVASYLVPVERVNAGVPKDIHH